MERVEELEHIAEAGESNKTPLILISGVCVISATAMLVLLALALVTYELAS